MPIELWKYPANMLPSLIEENKMSETLYVVCKIGYEYNDEIYYAPETDTAVPVKAYRSKEKADAEANKLT